MAQPEAASRLLELPTELLHHILTYLGPNDLAAASSTCRSLHNLSAEDRLWQHFIQQQLPTPLKTAGPAGSYRKLYTAFRQYWFLPRNRLWFGDCQHTGKLLLASYDEESGSIVAHTVTATRGPHTLSFWERNQDVIIHSFNPRIALDSRQPVLKIDLDSVSMDDTSQQSRDKTYAAQYMHGKEVVMPIVTDAGLFSSFMLCRALPPAAIGPQAQLWPPLRFPSASRTRNDSNDHFSSLGHRPTRSSEVSEETFRLHTWVEYTGRRSAPNALGSITSSLSALSGLTGFGMAGPYLMAGVMDARMPDNITTYATLPESCYRPTTEKPWQGIWCGDYSGHGCEFLVIRQPDEDEEQPLPEGMNWLREWLRNGRRGSSSSDGSYSSAWEELEHFAGDSSPSTVNSDPAGRVDDDDTVVPSGRLEAIKLTGDPNIPRGEYTFIAPDIGPGGFVRVAEEERFKGARVVRSVGHIAGRNFQQAQFTPSQLIMVSHDRLAQYWEGFGHISFYQRVDIDALTRL